MLALVAPLWLGAFFSSYAWTPADLFVHAATNYFPGVVFRSDAKIGRSR
jgi:hypothetical protein